MASSRFVPISAPFQKEIALNQNTKPGDKPVTFPLVLAAPSSSTVPAVLEAAAKLGQQPDQPAHQSELRRLLDANGGAIQFKNLPLKNAQDFSDFAYALAGNGEGKWVPHQDKGQMVLRHPYAPNVATANEGPPDHAIKTHNEFALSPHHPAYILFFCLSPPEEGGETPITSSIALYDRVAKQQPEFLEKLRWKGVSYTIHHPTEEVAKSTGGNGVFKFSAFGPENGVDLSFEEKRRIVEERIVELAAEGGWSKEIENDESRPEWQRKGFSWNWHENGGVDVVQRVPGVRIHPTRKVGTYFTNIATRYWYAKERGTLEPPHEYVKEDGTKSHSTPPYFAGLEKEEQIPADWCELVVETLPSELAAEVPWQVGDVLVIDNFAVQHARKPWTKGDRKLLASLWDEPGLSGALIEQPITGV